MFDADDLERWADAVLDEKARLAEHLTDDELRDREVIARADFFMLADAWLIAHPDDRRMREYLIVNEQEPPEFADAVLARMRELGQERWPDEFQS